MLLSETIQSGSKINSKTDQEERQKIVYFFIFIYCIHRRKILCTKTIDIVWPLLAAKTINMKTKTKCADKC